MSMEGDAILDRVNLANGEHVFELAETPKGLLEARIDGVPLTSSEAKELRDCLDTLPD